LFGEKAQAHAGETSLLVRFDYRDGNARNRALTTSQPLANALISSRRIAVLRRTAPLYGSMPNPARSIRLGSTHRPNDVYCSCTIIRHAGLIVIRCEAKTVFVNESGTLTSNFSDQDSP
jgi:hypothetical protein